MTNHRFTPFLRCLILSGCLALGTTAARADVAVVGDACFGTNTYNPSPTGVNDLGFHCYGYTSWDVFLLAPGPGVVSDHLWSASDEVYFSQDPSADSSVGQLWTGAGQALVADGTLESFTVNTGDGTFTESIQFTAPEPSFLLLLFAVVPAFVFAARRRTV